MGNKQSCVNINFEDMQECIKNKDKYIIINTLSTECQGCLIQGTIAIKNEVKIINSQINNNNKKVIIYGRNCNDKKVQEKYKQLISLGIYESYVYSGGLFEWLCLQDIYGDEEFPTTSKELDLLKFKPKKIITNHYLLMNE